MITDKSEPPVKKIILASNLSEMKQITMPAQKGSQEFKKIVLSPPSKSSGHIGNPQMKRVFLTAGGSGQQWSPAGTGGSQVKKIVLPVAGASTSGMAAAGASLQVAQVATQPQQLQAAPQHQVEMHAAPQHQIEIQTDVNHFADVAPENDIVLPHSEQPEAADPEVPREKILSISLMSETLRAMSSVMDLWGKISGKRITKEIQSYLEDAVFRFTKDLTGFTEELKQAQIDAVMHKVAARVAREKGIPIEEMNELIKDWRPRKDKAEDVNKDEVVQGSSEVTPGDDEFVEVEVEVGGNDDEEDFDDDDLEDEGTARQNAVIEKSDLIPEDVTLSALNTSSEDVY